VFGKPSEQTPGKEGRKTPRLDYRREYDPYSLQDDLYIEEEPVYVPRSVMADIIHPSEDDLVRRRHRPEDLIELPSGARQKVTRTFSESLREVENMDGVRMRKVKQVERERETVGPRKNVIPVKKETGLFELGMVNQLVGLSVMIVLAYKYSYYLHQLHENELWFTEITELEREISFRTEQGLYYSYFKQLVSAPTLSAGVADLKMDNVTESGRTINIIQRFNVHQEIFLASFYNIYNFGLRPILFYTYFVFSLQGLYLCALYLIAWSLSGTWFSGVLTVVYVLMNRFDVTRVTFTVPLREHFSLPFIFMQFYTTGIYLRDGKNFQLLRIFVFGVMYTVSWQFAQFVSLLQALSLFGLATLGLLNKDKVCRLLGAMFCSILAVWYLQYYQPMIIISLVVSFIPVAVLSLQSETESSPGRGVSRNLVVSVTRVMVALAVTAGLNTVLKLFLRQTADNHIFKFLKNKISRDTSDFDTQLYLCNEAFQWLDFDTYARLTSSSVLPLYLIFATACLIAYASKVISRWKSVQNNDQCKDGRSGQARQSKVNGFVPSVNQRGATQESLALFDLHSRPDLCFHLGQSVLLGLLAMSTLRMKCFWTPYLCILSAVSLSDPDLYNLLLNKVCNVKKPHVMNILRHLLLFSLIFYLGYKQKHVIDEEMEQLREFYDPDTVDLMQWIQQNTNQDDAISGSMQLMAGVKLCTGRPLTNHPHFEDKQLRERTKELYQMYAKVSPKTVYDNLKKYDAKYIILEDSICLYHRDRCSTTDIMDLVNNHIPEDNIQDPPFLEHSKYPRFCDEVRYDSIEYRRMFTKVFENRTFRVYRLS